MITKKKLAIELSKLDLDRVLDASLEQYDTPSEIAAELLWYAHMQGAIENRSVVDLGCGSGILGKGALLLGAREVYFVDVDENAISLAKKNVSEKNAFFERMDVADFDGKHNTVIMNPPFGVQVRKADKAFLRKAFKVSKEIFSIHKRESGKFIDGLIKDTGFEVMNVVDFKLMLKKTYDFHKQDKRYVSVGAWHLKKEGFK
jgi:putative methylase